MQVKNQARIRRQITSLNPVTIIVGGCLSIVTSMALAGDPRPPSCLTTDGSVPEPGATCCDATPTEYADENGPLGSGTVIGKLVSRADTFHSIGFAWDINGDADHDGTVSVRYRKAGACNFSPAMPLIRNDYAWFYNDEAAEEPINNFAGSLMFLTPGATYEVVLELSDPDGGRAIRVQELTTRAMPRKPTAGRTLYVVPGSGGGDGSDGNPFRGIDAANASARPGDRMLLRNGTYSRGTLTTSGAEDNHIVYEPDAGHSPVIDAIAVGADHIWIDNLAFVWNDPTNGTVPILDQRWWDTSGVYVPPPSSNNPDDVIITNSTFNGYANGIASFYEISRWVAMDNTIVGHWHVGAGGEPNPGASTGKGITLGGENTPGGPGCVLAYNSVTRVTDGINMSGDSDLYGNQVWDIAGNAVSTDGAFGNVRIWGNRFHYSAGAPMTFQPQKIGPWYYLYNQMASSQLGLFKFRTLDRAVLINNTFVGAGELRGQYFMRFVMRNNLFIDEGGTIWNTSPSAQDEQYSADWNTDIDYDGFDRGSPNNYFFNWFGNSVFYSSLRDWSVAVGGAEANAVEVDADLIFDDYVVNPFHSLELAAGSNNAVDAGAYVPNLADFHSGTAPDLGAHERGAEAIPYGPRSSNTPLDQRALFWVKH